jgi:hypothetical protein
LDDGDGTAAPGGGPYGAETARDEGDAVAANGFTGADTPPAGTGGPYAVDGTLICAFVGGAGELAGPVEILTSRLSDDGSVGAPQAAQNFREPMSSAPHFAQFVMWDPS